MHKSRKAKILALTLISSWVGGCARSDYRYAHQRPGPSPSIEDSRVANAPPLKPPKILPQTHFAAGRLFEQQGILGKAVTQYRKAIAVNHGYAEAYHRLGLVLSRAGRHQKAVAALLKAVELAPQDAVLQNNLGFEWMFQKRWARAELALRKAIELNPALARAHINLGLVLSKRGRFDDALASFRSVLPETDAHYNLGLMYRGQRRYEDAAGAFEHVLAIAPGFTAAGAQLEQIAVHIEPKRDDPAVQEVAVAHAPTKSLTARRRIARAKARGSETRGSAPVSAPSAVQSAKKRDSDTAALVRRSAESHGLKPAAQIVVNTDSETNQTPAVQKVVAAGPTLAQVQTPLGPMDARTMSGDVAELISIVDNELRCLEDQRKTTDDLLSAVTTSTAVETETPAFASTTETPALARSIERSITHKQRESLLSVEHLVEVQPAVHDWEARGLSPGLKPAAQWVEARVAKSAPVEIPVPGAPVEIPTPDSPLVISAAAGTIARAQARGSDGPQDHWSRWRTRWNGLAARLAFVRDEITCLDDLAIERSAVVLALDAADRVRAEAEVATHDLEFVGPPFETQDPQGGQTARPILVRDPVVTPERANPSRKPSRPEPARRPVSRAELAPAVWLEMPPKLEEVVRAEGTAPWAKTFDELEALISVARNELVCWEARWVERAVRAVADLTVERTNKWLPGFFGIATDDLRLIAPIEPCDSTARYDREGVAIGVATREARSVRSPRLKPIPD